MAVLRLVDQISSELDNGNITVGVFIDLSKAFDTIDHSVLLDKLQMYGIRGKAIEWLRSYLTDWSQFVGIGKNQSNKKRIKCGVPQGSILGPLLFIIYINDIVNASTILSMVLFADDTNIFISGRDLSEICATSNKELHKLSRWFKLSILSLTLKKTNFMLFKPKGKVICTYPDIYIDETKINKVNWYL